MTSIAEKYAAQWMPNGEVSLADLIQEAINESKSVAVMGEPDCYDAGLLCDFGGGNVEWWQDYIRAELARAHDFYASQWPSAIPATELATLREQVETHATELRAYEATVENHAERIRQLEAKLVPSPSCRECANRGRVNGLSQESYCDSCVWQGQSFRVNQYAAAPQPKKENGND